MSAPRFNPPPGWPVAPDGWLPPVGWEPDPSWPPVPEGWVLVTEADNLPSPPLSRRATAKAIKAQAKSVARDAKAQRKVEDQTAAARVKESRKTRSIAAAFGGLLVLDGDLYTKKHRIGSLAGGHATVDVGATSRRVTGGRVLALGVLALAAKQTTGGDGYVTIVTPTFDRVVKFDGKRYGSEKRARKFAAIVNQVALQGSGPVST